MCHITGILLAAGASRRFGGHKQLALLENGTPMAVAAARNLRKVLDDVVAVIRPGDDQLAALLAREGLRVVVCDQAHLGMGHSLSSGVLAASASEAWLVALADMPDIAAASIAKVAGSILEGAVLAAACYRGRRGHPVAFGQQFRNELLALHGDSGAKALLTRHAGLLERVDVEDPAVLNDIDTPQELFARDCRESNSDGW